MRILLTGSGSFRDALVDRLKREKNDIYTIGTTEPDKKTFHYDFKCSDEKIKHIIAGIMPEVIIFLGALDEEYATHWSQEQAMDYLAGLTNVLISANQVGVKHIIYISSTQIYGTELGSQINEENPKNPHDIRSLMISEGESLCLNYSRLGKAETVILRLSEVYGLACAFDFTSRLFLEAATLDAADGFQPNVDIFFNPIYISEAVDAVCRVVSIHKGSGIYNVTGNECFLSHFYTTINQLIKEKPLDNEAMENLDEGPELIIPTEFPLETTLETPPNEDKEIDINELLTLESNTDYYQSIIVERTYDGTLFSEKYGYRPIIDIKTGLAKTYSSKRRRLDRIKKAELKKNKRFKILAPLFPYLETIFAFVVFAFLHYWVPENIPSLASFDFLMLMVVTVAITLGGIHPILAVMMSALLLIWQLMSGGDTILAVLLNMGVIIRILNLLIIATICGYARDHMRTVMHEKNLEVDDLSNELVTIYKINASNTKIKTILDERLTGYDDSLAKMFVITDKLNALSPEQVFFEAVEVISDIMQCMDVSIYAVTGTDFKMCRLIAHTPSSNRTFKISVPFEALGELSEVVANDEIYVNRQMKENTPMMAAPVFSGRELVSIIMLWDMPFDKLSLYHINRFMTMSRLIASSLGRAYTHTKDIRELNYIPGTDILTADAFNEKLAIFKEALVKEAAAYMTIIVSPAKARKSLNQAELAAMLRPTLRTNDYIGEVKDQPESLYILLSNTSRENLGIVFERLAGVGLQGQEIIL